MFDYFVDLLIFGVSVGMVYGLVALGIALIFSGLDIIQMKVEAASSSFLQKLSRALWHTTPQNTSNDIDDIESWIGSGTPSKRQAIARTSGSSAEAAMRSAISTSAELPTDAK